MDSRILKLAKNLVSHSCRVQKGEKVLIEIFGDTPKNLAKALVKEIHLVRGLPFVTLKDQSITRELLKSSTKEQLELMAKYELERMKDMDCYIGIRGSDNTAELSDVEDEKMRMYSDIFMLPVH